MLAGFPKRLGRGARIRRDARRTDAPEDSRGRPRGNRNAMGRTIGIPVCLAAGMGKIPGGNGLPGWCRRRGWLCLGRTCGFGFAGRNVAANKSVVQHRWAVMNRTAEAAQELSCNPKLANTVNRWAGMRNRRQVVEFSDCLLARNAGLRLQENNGQAWPEVVFSFLGANGGSKSSGFGGRRRPGNFPTCGTGVRVGEPSKTRWGTRTRELVSSATGIGWDVCRLETGNATSVLGHGSVLGVGTGGRRLGDSRPPKATPCQTCASNVSGRRPGSLSLATLLSGPVESGTIFRGHEEKEQNRNCDKPLLSNK